MSPKLKSRKLWVAVGTVVSILLAEFAGVAVTPEAVAGLAFIVMSYLFSQGIVDKSVVSEQVKVAGDAGKLQLQLYARNLEAELEKVLGVSPGAVDLSLVPEPGE